MFLEKSIYLCQKYKRLKVKFSKEIKAGLIAVLAIVGFILLFQFMKGKSFFTTDNVFYAKYDNVEGLEVSSPVSINGLKVGQVDEIKPITDKTGKIHFVIKTTVSDEFQFSKKIWKHCIPCTLFM